MREQYISQPQQTKETPIPQWEEVMLGDERFMAKRGFTSDLKMDNREDLVTTTVDVYRHIETGMSIIVRSLGLDRPNDQPVPIRADYDCPCMDNPSNQHMRGHDCLQQRNLMQNTMAQLGIGVIAVIKEQTAAGNGHGPEAVFTQETVQHNAHVRGEPIPTMQQVYSQEGFYGDLRRHDIVAKVIKATIGDRPAIPTTSNTGKIQQFKDTGINVVPNTRIELVTSQSTNRQTHAGRRDYDYLETGIKPGAYLVNGYAVLLTPKVYYEKFVAEHHTPQDRILTGIRRFKPRLLN